jgi:CheY-like chemotaxis protein
MKKKILIIEDDPVMGLVCQRLLAKCGFATDLATDGASGIERLPSFQPDAVFLDLMMPKVNGITVLEWIRAQESVRQLPVIVLTNAAVPMLLEQAVKSGATHILDKSKFNPVAMTELLRGLLDLGPSNAKGVMSQTDHWKPLAAK